MSRRWTEGVAREVLPNGLTLLAQREPSAPAVAMVTHVKAGYFDEPDDVSRHRARARAHVLQGHAHAAASGQIARETKAAGGYLNASTIYDHTAYYAVLPAAELAAGARDPGRRLRNSADRRRRARARARGHHPGGQAKSSTPRRRWRTRRCTR